jgi:iron complex transport system permease protein
VTALQRNAAATSLHDRARRRRLALGLGVATALLTALGLVTGSAGWSWAGFSADLHADPVHAIVWQIRAPRTLGAFGVGALLGLAGALAQGLFRNPLADPYLIGSAAGAGLAVVLVLAASSLSGAALGAALGTDLGTDLAAAPAAWLEGLGVVLAAFLGALGGVLLALAIARGALHTLRLLLAGVVVGVLLGAVSDLVTTFAPQTLRAKQTFMLGSTGMLGWGSVLWLGAGLGVALPLALRHARVLDALTLGEDSAASLGLDLPRARLWLVLVLALATGLAVSQAGLVAFVGLVAPHLVRRFAPAAHGYGLAASSAAGGTLLLGADVLSRALIAPQELPVGVLTAVLGGGYLLWLLYRRGLAA